MSGHRLVRCDVGYELFDRRLAKRQLIDYMQGEGENRLTHSSYHTDLWTCDATDKSAISIGTDYDYCYVRLNQDNTTELVRGAQTWDGEGTLRTIVALDASSYESICFSCVVGPHQESTDPAITISMGLCSSDGTTTYELKSWSTTVMKRVWCSSTIADLPTGTDSSALYFYITVTPATDQYWWADEFQVESNTLRPRLFIKTAGAAVVISADTARRASVVTCPKCRTKLLQKGVTPPPVSAPRPIQVEYESPVKRR